MTLAVARSQNRSQAYATLTLVVPTYNEAANVRHFLDGVAQAVPGARVLFADDDSDDGTRAAAEAYQGPLDVRVLHRRKNLDRGLTASVTDALLHVETEYVAVCDADLQHPPHTLRELHASLENGHDLAVATRERDDAFSRRRRLLSRGARILARHYLRRRGAPTLRDPMSGYFAARTAAVQPIVQAHGARFERAGFKVLVDLLLHAPDTWRVTEVDYTFQHRHAGESKLTRRHYMSFLRQLGTAGRVTASLLELLLSGILFRFAAVGASGILVNQFTLFGLHEGLALPLLVASAIAIEFAVLWNFAWNESWTFRGRGGDTMWNRLGKFHLASLAGMAINLTVVGLGAIFLPTVSYLTTNLLGILMGSGVNFLINLNWTWGVPVTETLEDEAL